MQRGLAVGLISAVFVLVSLPLAAQDAQQQPAHPGSAPAGEAPQHHAMPKPTNLQVLPKDIASADLIKLMRGYTKALGVECGFCHADDTETHRLNFASDAKPDKGIARIMITMTQEINQKYLSTVNDPDATPADKTVTCGTCHRGNQMPAVFGEASGGEMHHDAAPTPPKPE